MVYAYTALKFDKNQHDIILSTQSTSQSQSTSRGKPGNKGARIYKILGYSEHGFANFYMLFPTY